MWLHLHNFQQKLNLNGDGEQCVWGGGHVCECVCIHVTCTKFIYGTYERFSTQTLLYSDATHGVKQTACLCLLRMLRVNAGHLAIDQYANKIVSSMKSKTSEYMFKLL